MLLAIIGKLESCIICIRCCKFRSSFMKPLRPWQIESKIFKSRNISHLFPKQFSLISSNSILYNDKPLNPFRSCSSHPTKIRLDKISKYYPVPCQPAVFPYKHFDPLGDAKIIRASLEGFMINKQSILFVLARRSNSQRLVIAKRYKNIYREDLVDKLRSELDGKFKQAIMALMTPLPDFYAQEIHDAINDPSRDSRAIIEVLCTLSNYGIKKIAKVYKNKFGNSLTSDLESATTGHFTHLLVSLCNAKRDEIFEINELAANGDAKRLMAEGVKRWGTEESIFNEILLIRNYMQMRYIFQEYERLTGGESFEDAVRRAFAGKMEDGYVTIVRFCRHKSGYFANRLFESMTKMGTDDKTLIRIIVARSEIDLGDIRTNFEIFYDKSLLDKIEENCSENYKELLIALAS